jgi:hypothetical protein
MIGTSLGSGFGFLASAHDRRIEVNVFNHCCATISDVVWEGLPHLRRKIEPHVTPDELRECWRPIHANSFFDRMARFAKRSLLVIGRYDTIFPRRYVREALGHFRDYKLCHKVIELPCGHGSLGRFPYAIVDCYQLCSFIRQNL